jgi:hypothetical protein
VRGVLVYCADYRCSHSTKLSAVAGQTMSVAREGSPELNESRLI